MEDKYKGTEIEAVLFIKEYFSMKLYKAMKDYKDNTTDDIDFNVFYKKYGDKLKNV